MIKRNKRSLTLIMGTLFLFPACDSSKVPAGQGGFYYSGIYFGKHFSPNYQQGIVDGCTTAKGDYKKSHQLFNNDIHYNKGWFLGRYRCKDLLIIKEN